MFKLPAETEFLSSFECSIITPSTSQSPRAAKGDKGVMYVLKYAFAFIGSDQSKRVTWLTDAMAVQELVVEGLNGIEMNTADGSKITINCMKERDEVFDNMIAMLEMMPVTDEPALAGDGCGAQRPAAQNRFPTRIIRLPAPHRRLSRRSCGEDGGYARDDGVSRRDEE